MGIRRTILGLIVGLLMPSWVWAEVCHVANDVVPYNRTFHDDTGTVANPTSPVATLQITTDAGVDTYSALTTPVNINSETGRYGGEYPVGASPTYGTYIITMRGAVPTAKTVDLTARIFRVQAACPMPTYTQPSGFLAATFPSGTVANTTNITGGTITTATNLTNLPAITANWLTGAGIAASAFNGKGDWNIGKTGYSLTQAFPTNFASLSVTAGGLVDITQAAADKTWDTVLASHLTAGSTGAALNAAGAAGDPWSTALPGAYGAGTAGKIIGDNINATISSRSTYAGGDTAGTTTLLTRIPGVITPISIWDELESSATIAGSLGMKLRTMRR